MKKVEAIIKPLKLDGVKEALSTIGVRDLTINAVDFAPKLKLAVVVPNELAAQVVETIERAARTENGPKGDL